MQRRGLALTEKDVEKSGTSTIAVSNSEAVGSIDAGGLSEVPAGSGTSDASCGGSTTPGTDAGDAARGDGEEGPEAYPQVEGDPEDTNLFISTVQTRYVWSLGSNKFAGLTRPHCGI